MAPNPSTTSLLDSMKIIEVLKNLILDQVHAVHGRSYTASHYTFSVITSVVDFGKPRAPNLWYCAQAIVYTTPGSLAEWKLLVDSDGGDSTQEAVEILYYKVQEQAYEITRCMDEGEVWNEAAAKEAKEAEEAEAAEKMEKMKKANNV